MYNMPSCIYSTEYDVINRVSYFLRIYNMSGDSQHALVCIYCTSSVMVFMQCSLLAQWPPTHMSSVLVSTLMWDGNQ